MQPREVFNLFTDEMRFKHFNGHIYQSYKMSSRQLSKRTEKTVENMRSTLSNVGRPRTGGRRARGEGPSVKNLKFLERRGVYLVRDGAQVSTENMLSKFRTLKGICCLRTHLKGYTLSCLEVKRDVLLEAA